MTGVSFARRRYSVGTHPVPPPVAAFAISTSVSFIAVLAIGQPLLALGLASLVLLAVVVTIRPEDATLVVLALLYSNAAVIAVKYHGVPAFASAAVPLLLLLPLAHVLLVQRRGFILVRPLPWVAGFGLVQVAGTIAASSSSLATTALGTFVLEGFLLYLVMTNVLRTPHLLRRAVWVLLLVGASLGLLSVVQEVTHSYGNDYLGFAQVERGVFSTDGGDTMNGRRLGGPLGQHNRYAQMMVVLIPLGLVQLRSERTPWLRMAARISVGLIALAVVLTFSRGAAVALGLALLAMVVRRYIGLRSLLVFAVVTGVVLVAVPSYRSRLSTLGSVTEITSGDQQATAIDSSVSSRLTENVTAMRVFLAHPVLGVGPGRFGVFYQDVAQTVDTSFKNVKTAPREAHNLYLGVAAENGVLGLICLGGAFASTLSGLAHARRRCAAGRPELGNLAAGCTFAIVAYMGSAVFLHFAFIRFFWLLMALGAATTTVALNEPELPVEPGSNDAESSRPARWVNSAPSKRGSLERLSTGRACRSPSFEPAPAVRHR